MGRFSSQMWLLIIVAVIITVTGAPLWAGGQAESMPKGFRAPAVPLVAYNPYFSIWSFNTTLTDGPTRHWTGEKQALTSMVRIDGKAYRIMGDRPGNVPALEQQSCTVLPTRTIYEFGGEGIKVELTFLTPRIPDDLALFSSPVTYLTWRVAATDGKPHQVQLYFDGSGSLVINHAWQRADGRIESVPGLRVAQLGSRSQKVLGTKGDDVRIDWGYLYIASPESESMQSAIGIVNRTQRQFVDNGSVTSGVAAEAARVVLTSDLDAAFTFELGTVGATPVSRHILLAYDEIYSIAYFGKNLPPYWRANGVDAAQMLVKSEADYPATVKLAESFDNELMQKLDRVGGERYAQIAALAYRQSFAAQTVAVGPQGQPLLFPKENSSNGCISTVDVIYPSAPVLLLLSPQLLVDSLIPVFDYAESGAWNFPFAPHDLGTYPVADGQVYGGGATSERDQMPVEESGNMILLTAAVSRAMAGGADPGAKQFVSKYWSLLSRWAEYLKKAGFDPANQLSTDDFAGHLAHNANLSLKAILALGAYAYLAGELGHEQVAADYRATAEAYARQWVDRAKDGDHYKLAFDLPGSWSQKYNLIWDTVLGLHLFPPEVRQRIVRFDLAHIARYGLPLDSRKSYTKLDWEFWTASLAESRSDFQKLTDPIWNWANNSIDRVPLTDWYDTKSGMQQGFQARSVVGGVFMPVLADKRFFPPVAGK